jgi:hypothetical protein
LRNEIITAAKTRDEIIFTGDALLPDITSHPSLASGFEARVVAGILFLVGDFILFEQIFYDPPSLLLLANALEVLDGDQVIGGIAVMYRAVHGLDRLSFALGHGEFLVFRPVGHFADRFGLALASRLCEGAGPILVVAAEKLSPTVLREPRDKGTAVLFGDGAGACLVDPEQGLAAVVDSVMASDGSFTESLRLEHNAPVVMDGRTVILQASRKIPNAIRTICSRHGVNPQDVPVFLMHQENAIACRNC